MRQFHDSAGRPWAIAMNVAAAKRIRDLAGVNILDLRGGQLFEELARDPLRFCDCLYAAVKPQCDLAGVGQEQFLEGLNGDVSAAATEAFLDELIDFFPPRIRTALHRAIEGAKRVQEKLETALAAAAAGPDLEARIEEAMTARTSTPGSAFTASPAGSESSPTT